MKVAVVGCAHGEVEKIYETLEAIEKEKECKVDLLLCCGDFQAVRDKHDLESMVRSKDYHDIGTFFKYYNGSKTAPVLTIFIGGNHEASNYMQELPFGGWVAPNIYYLGNAGCVNYNGVRIAGSSGIYKKYNYRRGHYEFAPYTEDTKRSVYHVRELEVFRLKQLSNKVDIFMSHDWPRNVDKFGDAMTAQSLVAIKPHFREHVENQCLGSPANKEILEHLKPSHWFAGHLHCRFTAVVPHSNDSETKFLALDKAVDENERDRQFLEVVDIDVEPDDSPLSYDLEWLTILHLTEHLSTGKKTVNFMPNEFGTLRWNYTPTDEEKECVLSKFDNNLVVPLNFCRTTKPYDLEERCSSTSKFNPQTATFCNALDIDDPVRIAVMTSQL